MENSIAYWVVSCALILSMFFSMCYGFRAIIKCTSNTELNSKWCYIIDSIFVYLTFIVLYMTGSLGEIYDSVSDYLYSTMGWNSYIWIEAGFLLIVIAIWIASSLPGIVMRIITSGQIRKAIKDECEIFWRLFLTIVAVGYIFLIEMGPFWAIIPFIVGVIYSLGISVYEYDNSFQYIITWKIMIWSAAQTIAVLGMGLIARELMKSWLLCDAMGTYDFSYGANLLSLVFMGNLIIWLFETAQKYLQPTLFIPMAPSDIEKWKEIHMNGRFNSSNANGD